MCTVHLSKCGGVHFVANLKGTQLLWSTAVLYSTKMFLEFIYFLHSTPFNISKLNCYRKEKETYLFSICGKMILDICIGINVHFHTQTPSVLIFIISHIPQLFLCLIVLDSVPLIFGSQITQLCFYKRCPGWHTVCFFSMTCILLLFVSFSLSKSKACHKPLRMLYCTLVHPLHPEDPSCGKVGLTHHLLHLIAL